MARRSIVQACVVAVCCVLLGATSAGCTKQNPDAQPALAPSQLLRSHAMTVAAPGATGRPLGHPGDADTETVGLRVLTYGSDAEADAGSVDLARRTSSTIRWRGVLCTSGDIQLGGEEVVGGVAAGVSLTRPATDPTVTLGITSPDVAGARAPTSSTIAPSVIPVTGEGCWNPALARAIAAAARPG